MMSDFGLQINPWGLVYGLAILSLILFLQWRYRRNENSPAVLYSDISGIETVNQSWRIKLVALPMWCKKLAFILFILAICDPVVRLPQKYYSSDLAQHLQEMGKTEQKGLDQVHIPTEGLAIYFILDQSGSMREEIDFSIQGLSAKHVTRIEALKFFTTQFISGNQELGLKGRPDDLIGIVSFARVPKVISPLTLDHEEVKKQLKEFAPIANSIEEGTAIGYAIYKTAHTIAATEHFSREILGQDKPAYDIKSTIMILVTDGLQNPSSEDLEHPIRRIGVKEAAEFAKEKGIRLYIINIQPQLDFIQRRNERNSQKEAAELTGGQFFLASDAQALHRIYRVIDGLERSKHYGTNKHQVIVEENLQSTDQKAFVTLALYSALITGAMMLLFTAILLETTVLKRVP